MEIGSGKATVVKAEVERVDIRIIRNGNFQCPLTKFKNALNQLMLHEVHSYTGHILLSISKTYAQSVVYTSNVMFVL